MKKIRITESQLAMLREYQKSNVKNIRITESQLKMLQETLKAGPMEKKLDSAMKQNKLEETEVLSEGVEFLEFAQAVIQAIKFFFTDPGQNGLSPFWVKMGMSAGEVRSMIAGSGLITTAMGVGGEPAYKMVRKGFINLMKRLYNTFKERRYDMYNKGKVIDKQATHVNNGQLEEDNFPPGVTPGSMDAPWNRDDVGRNNSNDHFQVVKNFGDFAILVDPHGDRYFMDVANFRYGVDDEELENELNTAVETGELKIDSAGQQLFGMDMISKLTPENIETLLDQDDNPELVALIGNNQGSISEEAPIFSGFYVVWNDESGEVKFVNVKTNEQLKKFIKTIPDNWDIYANREEAATEYKRRKSGVTPGEGEIEETTTTGSVGGSYETPKIWSKNPNKGRFFDEPMIKGGKMVKRRKLSELEKVDSVKYAVEMDMFLSGKDEKDVKLQIIEIENFINKRYDASARVTNVKEVKFGALGESEENKDEILD